MKSIINQLRNNLRYGVKSKVQEQRIYSELHVQVFIKLHRQVHDHLASQIKNNLSHQINSNIKL
jgi:hypothetical protein